MTTIVFGVDGNPASNWPQALFTQELISYGTLIYLVSTERALFTSFTNATVFEGRSASEVKAFDGGVELTRAADYASEAELLNESPEPGHCRWYTAGPTYVRLGSEPAFDLRVIASGYQTSGIGHSTTSLSEEAGLTGTFNGRMALAARFVADAGTTYLDVFNDQAALQLVYFGLNRFDEFEAVRFKAPTGDPVYTFDEDNVLSMRVQPPEGMPVPVYSLTANVGETWPSTLATGAPKKSRDEMQREPWFSTWKHENTALLLKHKLAASVVVDSQARTLQNNLSWTEFRDKYMALFGVEREQVTVEVLIDSNTLALDLNDVVAVRSPRMGYSAGKLFRVIVQRLDLATMRAEYVLWG